MIQAEESWTEVELKEVGYVDKAQDFLVVNTIIDDEVELLELKIVMTVDEAGHSTSIACGIMVVKIIQGKEYYTKRSNKTKYG